jgi:hypothetical protein
MKIKSTKAKSAIITMAGLALIATGAVINHNNSVDRSADASLAPAGSTLSNVTCTEPGVRGSGSCDVDISSLNPALSGTLTFQIGNTPAYEIGTDTPGFNLTSSGSEAMLVDAGGNASGSGTLAYPNSILVNGVGSSIPVTRAGAASGVSNSLSGTVIFPNTMIYIGQNILSSGCDGPSDSGTACGSGITNIQFEDGGTQPLTIMGGGFGTVMSGLTGAIEFPGRLTLIGQSNRWTYYLTGVVFNEGDYPLTITDGIFSNSTSGGNIPTAPNLTGTVNLPSNTALITNGAFQDSGITGLTIADGGTFPLTITGNAFADSNITGNVNFPESTTLIDNSAFAGTKLTGVSFTDGGTYPLTINNEAFRNIGSLTGNVNFPANTELITNSAFAETKLTGVSFTDGGTQPLTITNSAFWGLAITGNINFPANTTLITNGAFDGNPITGISFTDGGTQPLTINNMAFSCTNITGTITFPTNLIAIDTAHVFWSDSTNGYWDEINWEWVETGNCIAFADNGVNLDSANIDAVIFSNTGGAPMANIHAQAFKPMTPFLNACSTGLNFDQAIVEFLAPDGVTPLLIENDFGCGMQIQDPELSVDGYELRGWHLNANFSDPALTFPWVPFAGMVLVDDLLVYGDWVEVTDGGDGGDGEDGKDGEDGENGTGGSGNGGNDVGVPNTGVNFDSTKAVANSMIVVGAVMIAFALAGGKIVARAKKQ